MSENGEIYTAGKNFTLPPALTAWTNSTSEPLDKTEIFRIGQVLYPSLVGACVVTLYALMHISDDYLSTSLCSFFIKALNSLVSFLPLFFLVTFFSSSWLGKENQPWVIFQMELVSLLKCYQCPF